MRIPGLCSMLVQCYDRWALMNGRATAGAARLYRSLFRPEFSSIDDFFIRRS
jgi:hypothetical protein